MQYQFSPLVENLLDGRPAAETECLSDVLEWGGLFLTFKRESIRKEFVLNLAASGAKRQPQNWNSKQLLDVFLSLVNVQLQCSFCSEMWASSDDDSVPLDFSLITVAMCMGNILTFWYLVRRYCRLSGKDCVSLYLVPRLPASVALSGGRGSLILWWWGLQGIVAWRAYVRWWRAQCNGNKSNMVGAGFVKLVDEFGEMVATAQRRQVIFQCLNNRFVLVPKFWSARAKKCPRKK